MLHAHADSRDVDVALMAVRALFAYGWHYTIEAVPLYLRTSYLEAFSRAVTAARLQGHPSAADGIERLQALQAWDVPPDMMSCDNENSRVPYMPDTLQLPVPPMEGTMLHHDTLTAVRSCDTTTLASWLQHDKQQYTLPHLSDGMCSMDCLLLCTTDFVFTNQPHCYHDDELLQVEMLSYGRDRGVQMWPGFSFPRGGRIRSCAPRGLGLAASAFGTLCAPEAVTRVLRPLSKTDWWTRIAITWSEAYQDNDHPSRPAEADRPKGLSSHVTWTRNNGTLQDTARLDNIMLRRAQEAAHGTHRSRNGRAFAFAIYQDLMPLEDIDGHICMPDLMKQDGSDEAITDRHASAAVRREMLKQGPYHKLMCEARARDQLHVYPALPVLVKL